LKRRRAHFGFERPYRFGCLLVLLIVPALAAERLRERPAQELQG
jgi:hypothetical protein